MSRRHQEARRRHRNAIRRRRKLSRRHRKPSRRHRKPNRRHRKPSMGLCNHVAHAEHTCHEDRRGEGHVPNMMLAGAHRRHRALCVRRAQRQRRVRGGRAVVKRARRASGTKSNQRRQMMRRQLRTRDANRQRPQQCVWSRRVPPFCKLQGVPRRCSSESSDIPRAGHSGTSP